MLIPSTLQNLRAGDRCIIDDGSARSGQEVILADRTTASEFHPPPSETRWPVIVPESGRLLLFSASTPVLIED